MINTGSPVGPSPPNENTGLPPTCAGCGWILSVWNSVTGWRCMNADCRSNKKEENCPHCQGTGKMKRVGIGTGKVNLP